MIGDYGPRKTARFSTFGVGSNFGHRVLKGVKNTKSTGLMKLDLIKEK